MASPRERSAYLCLMLLLIAPLLLGACAATTPEALAPDPVTYPLPESAFTDGSSLLSGGGPVTIRTVEMGDLNLPSGRIVAMDPFSDPAREAFALHVAPGRYPVVLSLIQPEGWPAPVIAAAKVQFGPGTPVRWALALIPGQDPGALGEDEFYGFPVDAGSACLASAEAARIHARRTTVLGMPNLPYIMRLSREMEARAEDGIWAMVEVNARRGLNAAFLTSGYGDGAYAAYWGYGAAGEVAALVVDFGTID